MRPEMELIGAEECAERTISIAGLAGYDAARVASALHDGRIEMRNGEWGRRNKTNYG